MKQSDRNDRIFSTASWIIVFALLFGVGYLWVFPPTGAGPVAQLIGIQGSQIFYTVLYSAEALLLGFAKVFKKKKLRKAALLTIYLTAMFTTILTFILAGVGFSIIDNVLLAVLSFACFLYWKFKTEYLDPDVFYEDIKDLKDGP